MIGARRHGVPGPEHAVVLGQRGRRRHYAVAVSSFPGARRRRMDHLRAAVARPRSTPASIWGKNLWIISIIDPRRLSLMGSINYITTIVNMRAPGMTFFRLPLTIWSLVHHRDSAAAGAASAHRRARHVAFRSELRHAVSSSRRRRSTAAVATSVLVLRTSRSLYLDSARDGRHLGYSCRPSRASRSSVITRWRLSMIAIAFLSWIVWGHHMFQSAG